MIPFDMNMGAIMDARSLACYIKKYFSEHSTIDAKCSDIMIQKCLYFLFAYWGGYISKGEKENNFEIKKEKKFLFYNKIEAWEYGPVVRDVYFSNKRCLLDEFAISDDELFQDNYLLKSTIDGLLEDLIKISPFKLVTLSHQDESWIKNYKLKLEKSIPNQEIDKTDIINEYECKV